MTDTHFLRSLHEADTYRLFDTYLDNSDNWSGSAAIIGHVFKAKWYATLSIESIAAIGSALHGLTSFDPKPTLTRLVKAKVLRSRRVGGATHYEVNY